MMKFILQKVTEENSEAANNSFITFLLHLSSKGFRFHKAHRSIRFRVEKQRCTSSVHVSLHAPAPGDSSTTGIKSIFFSSPCLVILSLKATVRAKPGSEVIRHIVWEPPIFIDFNNAIWDAQWDAHGKEDE